MPAGMAVDAAGNVFVADSANHTIRKIKPERLVITRAGAASQSGSADGAGTAVRFNGAGRLATDAGGNVFVADLHNNTVGKITPAGMVSTLAGAAGQIGSADGAGTLARFNLARFQSVSGLATDAASNVIVGDTYNHTIRKITPDGVVSTLAGSAG